MVRRSRQDDSNTTLLVARKRPRTAPPPRLWRLAAALRPGLIRGDSCRAFRMTRDSHAKCECRKVWHRCHWAVTDRSNMCAKRAELRWLEPLASCMPCASGQSIPARHSRRGSLPFASALRGSRVSSEETW